MIRWLTCCCLVIQTILLCAEDWRQFRGPQASGIAQQPHPPTTLGEHHIRWQTHLPGRGLSSPIIVGNHVYLSAAQGDDQSTLVVMAFHESSGEMAWKKTFHATGRTMCHEKTCVAAPTPVSDGSSLCVLFSSNDLVSLNLDGTLRWYRGITVDYPNVSNSLGMASSPVWVDGVLVVQVENDSQSMVLGIDPESGTNRWVLSDRPKGANWTSPIPILHLDPPGVALQSSKGIHLVEARSGKLVGAYLDGAATIPSSVLVGSTLLTPSHGLTALDLSNPDSDLSVLWQTKSMSPATASPMVMDDAVFVVNNAGVLTRGSLDGGRRQWQVRLKGPFSASAVGFGHHQYWVNESGLLQVVDVSGQEGQVISSLDLGQTILSTPSVANGALYLRSDQQLWKIGAPPLL